MLVPGVLRNHPAIKETASARPCLAPHPTTILWLAGTRMMVLTAGWPSWSLLAPGQGQNGKLKPGNTLPVPEATGKGQRRMSDPESVSSVFSDTPIVV